MLRFNEQRKNFARAAFTAAQQQTAWTPTAGTKIRLMSLHVTVSAATVLTIKLGTTVIWERDFASAGGADALFPTNGLPPTATGDVLSITSSAIATCGGTFTGREE